MIYISMFIAFCLFYFEKEIKQNIQEFCKFMEFIHENNPLILSYYEYDDYRGFIKDGQEDGQEEEKEGKVEEEEKEKEKKVEEPYENKYLEKFKNFTDEYLFDEKDLKYKEVKSKEFVDKHYNRILVLEKKNNIINSQITDLNNTLKLRKENFEAKYPNCKLDVEDEDPNDDWTDECWDDYEEIRDLEKNIIDAKLKLALIDNEAHVLDAKTGIHVYSEAREEAHKCMIENKLNDFINNYIIEYTPVGNVVMRYNNYKKSFEYYSNHSVPYRYLETIGRKYVMTYKCKSLFIDIDKEVKKANEINEMNKNENKNKMKAKMKPKLNTMDYKKIEMPSNKNVQTIINPINEIEIAVKNANRYTCEGRFADFKIVKKQKKVDRSQISFKEFKRIQQQNKMDE